MFINPLDGRERFLCLAGLVIHKHKGISFGSHRYDDRLYFEAQLHRVKVFYNSDNRAVMWCFKFRAYRIL